MPTDRREWVNLGNTALDMASVVKIVFDRGDATLFSVAGESLMMTAWTSERAEIARLKEYARPGSGWIRVRAEETPDEEYADGDGAPARDDDAGDERVRSSAVDKIVVVDTNAHGVVAELFAQSVFVGQVVGEDDIEAARQQLGL